ncbi:MAG: sulfatase [Saccharofermentanales bacterium]
MNKSTKQPNILFILIDDMGWRDLGCYGSTFYETPNIDKLAAEGMIFTNAYASCPVCSPTRASIMSGKYPATVGVTNYISSTHPSKGRLIDAPYIDHLPLSEKSIASALKESGYKTWHVGKWHLGSREYYPDKHGFDINIGGCSFGMPNFGYFSPYKIETLEEGPDGEYLTDRLTDEAIRLIESNDKTSPFFLNMCHYAVHIPIQAPSDLVDKYRQKAASLGLDKQKALEEGDYFPADHLRGRRITRRLFQSDEIYAAMIENLDYNIGRLLDSLEKTGQTENTIIIFTSDNGGLSTSEGSPTCNSPLSEGKGWMYEGGVREPLIVKWKGRVIPSSACDVPVTSPDFYPTFLDAAGHELIPEQHKDGISMIPLLDGGKYLERDALYWHFPHYGNQGGTPGSSIRMGDYKLIEFFENGNVELYNLVDDIEEKHDLSASLPEITEKLKNKLYEWRSETDAKIPVKNIDYIPFNELI